jgi:hypothetical protein
LLSIASQKIKIKREMILEIKGKSIAKNSEVDILAKAIEFICKDGLKIKIISNLSPSLIKLV